MSLGKFFSLSGFPFLSSAKGIKPPPVQGCLDRVPLVTSPAPTGCSHAVKVVHLLPPLRDVYHANVSCVFGSGTCYCCWFGATQDPLSLHLQ